MSRSPGFLLKTGLLVASLIGMGHVGATQLRVAIDGNEVRCLPQTVFLMTLWETTPERGEVFAFQAKGLSPFFKDGSVFTKIVAGVPGDEVRFDADGVHVAGKTYPGYSPRILSKFGAEIPNIPVRRVLEADEYLMLGTEPQSFDGRYWGTIRSDQLIARALPLW